jgi:hypothetical protein
MEENYKRLLDLLSQDAISKSANLDEVVREAYQFFEGVKQVFQTGTPEEKQEMIRLMREVYTKLATQSQKITDKTGMSEEELLNFSENPNNFSPEQWRLMQEVKKKMSESGRQISTIIRGKPSKTPGEHKAPKGKKPRKPHKDQWMRS